tara:strand:- start:4782 stop:6713 length:1932 start_codon:yes stop_codon:yes gene_type:complete
MCGFTGIFHKNNFTYKETIFSMSDTIAHRGPDDSGYYFDESIGIGHNRLSIIGLSDAGRQPFFSQKKDIIAVFNGEIYNYRFIKKQLISLGYRFNGDSDGEIIPHLYKEKGLDFISELDGMFSILVYDKNKRCIYLFRDQFGIKPLYYYVEENYLIFGSEIKSIIASEMVKKKVDMQAIHDFLSLSYVPEPQTGFDGIYALEPSHQLFFSDYKPTIKRYSPHEKKDYNFSNEKNIKNQCKRVIGDSVKKHMISDVPIGSFLSGGIDSSLVSFYANSFNPNISLFNMGFPDEEYDESKYAKMIASTMDANYHQIEISANSADENLISIIMNHFDQPFADSSLIPTYLLSREISDHVKVALSGDGGDEFFAGYENNYRMYVILKLKKIPKVIRSAIIKMSTRFSRFLPNYYRKIKKAIDLSNKEPYEILFSLKSYLNEEQKFRLYSENILNNEILKDVKPTKRLFFDKNYTDNDLSISSIIDYISRNALKISLHSDMLKKVDMMSMLNGLEVRVPFLTNSVYNFSKKLDHKQKLKGSTSKVILRNILSDIFPKDIYKKKKWGFGIPIDKYASNSFNKFLKDTLLSDNSRIKNFINVRLVENWLNIFFNEQNNFEKISRVGLYQRIFMMLSLELWLRRFDLDISKK